MATAAEKMYIPLGDAAATGNGGQRIEIVSSACTPEGPTGTKELWGLPTALPLDYLNSIRILTMEIKELRKDIKALIMSIHELEAASGQEAVILQTMSREEAKREIRSLFERTERILYYSDIAKALNMDLRTVVEICEELEKESLIRFED